MRASLLCGRLYKDVLARSSPRLFPALAFATRAGRPGAALASRAAAKSSPADAASKREEALNNALGELNSKFGKGCVMKLSSRESLAVEWFSTGALTLDMALGGGIPKGRIVEIYGPESSGKTTLALQAIASAQKQGGRALLIDAEHAFSQDYAEKAGVNVNDLIINQPDTGEEALEVCDRVVRSQGIDLVVIDSVAALVPRAELEGEIGDKAMGLQARLMSQAARKISGNASKCNATVIFINQLRNKIGVIYGSPEVTSGGLALKYFCSIRIDVRRIEVLKSAKEDIGIRVKAKIVKNKVAAPFKIAEFDILFNSGVNILGSLIDAAEKLGIIVRKGAWYSYNDSNLAQGKEKVLEKLLAEPGLRQEIETKTHEAVKASITPVKPDNDTSSGGSISTNGSSGFEVDLESDGMDAVSFLDEEREAESVRSG